ncbi:C40 family peptidase [Wenjunlia tyrosinilytica]|uniref:NlpC/P60 domain-containing protein n=1 Tax=Wenjunlia tyrosinilytica TaxID=1544741 RepID=A0A917ZS54_9ACTN|nr:C40 family peptidase [Wenjunlia tyrosinilytica]GGO89835.1 hypothetical protein GCM10012280_34000 [Wenjunlia tyrosinilytica]
MFRNSTEGRAAQGARSGRHITGRRWVRTAGAVGGVLCGVALGGAVSPSSSAPSAPAADQLPERVPVQSIAALSDHTGQAAAVDRAVDRLGDEVAKDAAARREAAERKRKAAAAEARKKKAAREAAARREAAEERARASRSATRAALSPHPSASASTAAPQSSGGVQAAVSFALAQVGDSYVMGGNGPDAWDCSGLTQAAFARAGISLPRTADAQASAVRSISRSEVRSGDLLFWTNNGAASGVYHVGISLGGDRYVDAANPGAGVRTADFSFSAPQLFGRP